MRTPAALFVKDAEHPYVQEEANFDWIRGYQVGREIAALGKASANACRILILKVLREMACGRLADPIARKLLLGYSHVGEICLE